MSCREWEGLLDAHELGLLTSEQTRALEEHALDCDACFELLFESSELSLAFKERRREARDIRPASDAAPQRPWVAWAGLAAALLIAAVALVMLRPPPAPDDTLRGGEGDPAVLALSPSGAVKPPSTLVWEPLVGAVAHELRIHAVDGALVWEGHTEAPPLVLPEAARQLLVPGGSYAWVVRARMADGRIIESELVTFRVLP